jgi:hypothetical protein
MDTIEYMKELRQNNRMVRKKPIIKKQEQMMDTKDDTLPYIKSQKRMRRKLNSSRKRRPPPLPIESTKKSFDGVKEEYKRIREMSQCRSCGKPKL